MSREANRARFPVFAEIADSCDGCAKLLYAKDENGELGSLPIDPPNVVWISNPPPAYVHPKGKRL